MFKTRNVYFVFPLKIFVSAHVSITQIKALVNLCLVLLLLLAGSCLLEGTACIFSQLYLIFTAVCSVDYFSAFQISLKLLAITFFINIFTFCFFLFSLEPLAGRILGDSEILQVQLPYLIDFAQFLSQPAFHFTFWHSILVLYYIGITFFRNILLFLGRVPTTNYLMAQHTGYEHQMTLYRESAGTKAHVYVLLQGVGIIRH